MKQAGGVRYPPSWTDPDHGWQAVGQDLAHSAAAE
jgi:hypothetical protein